jgi:RND superfamily putative drug exporter
VSQFGDAAEQTKELVRTLRQIKLSQHLHIQVTGSPANTLDVLNGIHTVLPYAFSWILFFTYLVLLVLLRSVVLPIKAIVTTMLSLAASYGVLVFIIQQGHFANFLHFEPQGTLDISLCIIIFCALFGFSMDYEVFLLARIKEAYEKTGDTKLSIVTGIDQSSRIITSAAVIVILICYSFMSAEVLIVKAFGLGIAAAIFVDAFLIRLMLVPATMSLLNQWNWYCPAWIKSRLPTVFFDLSED